MDLLLLLKALILGLVEGATEFLPVSSTGHLIIVGDLIGFNDENSKVFKIVIQLGAILAICWEYRARLSNVATRLGSDLGAQRFALHVALAFLPAALLGLAFHDLIKAYLFSPVTVAVALILGGLVILAVERSAANPQGVIRMRTASVEHMTAKQALQIGCFQALSLVPGVSRAGATILGGMASGLSRQAATEFSFFVAIPIMCAATGYDLLKSWHLLAAEDFAAIAVGFITAFLAALVAVKTLLRYVAQHDFRVFAWYRIVFGLLVLTYFWEF